VTTLTDADLVAIVNRHRDHCLQCCHDEFCPEAAFEIVAEAAATVDASWRVRHKAAMARVEALRRPDPHPATDDLTWNAALNAARAAIRGETVDGLVPATSGGEMTGCESLGHARRAAPAVEIPRCACTCGCDLGSSISGRTGVCPVCRVRESCRQLRATTAVGEEQK